MNNNFKKSEVLILLVLSFLLLITVFLPSSLKPTFLYFVINFLVISLGAEAGLLSAFSNPSEHKNPLVQNVPAVPPEAIPRSSSTRKSTSRESAYSVEKSEPEKIIGVVKVEKVKSCSSVPSLFFIGSAEAEVGAEADVEEDAEDAETINGKEELSAKAEAFIGNFYKQLKMQREESLQKLHGFCQIAF